MNIVTILKTSIQKTVEALYDKKVSLEDLSINETKAEFSGDYTFVAFSLTKLLQKKPDEIAQELGAYLQANEPLVIDFEVIKGYTMIFLLSFSQVNMRTHILG